VVASGPFLVVEGITRGTQRVRLRLRLAESMRS
jgi:hypothetical protein